MLTDLDVLRMRINQGHDTIDALCQGRLRWEMRVPAEPNHDPDLILSDALRAVEQAIDELDAARKVVEAAENVAGAWKAMQTAIRVDRPDTDWRMMDRAEETAHASLRSALDAYAKVREGGQG